eukprot:2413329-Pleurochrysis_carterae.AAC.2
MKGATAASAVSLGAVCGECGPPRVDRLPERDGRVEHERARGECARAGHHPRAPAAAAEERGDEPRRARVHRAECDVRVRQRRARLIGAEQRARRAPHIARHHAREQRQRERLARARAPRHRGAGSAHARRVSAPEAIILLSASTLTAAVHSAIHSAIEQTPLALLPLLIPMLWHAWQLVSVGVRRATVHARGGVRNGRAGADVKRRAEAKMERREPRASDEERGGLVVSLEQRRRHRL